MLLTLSKLPTCETTLAFSHPTLTFAISDVSVSKLRFDAESPPGPSPGSQPTWTLP
jgi:hypothetical protein